MLVLEDLGCQTSALFLDISGEVYNLGSRAGTSFLVNNQDISIKFREFFGKKTLFIFDISVMPYNKQLMLR